MVNRRANREPTPRERRSNAHPAQVRAPSRWYVSLSLERRVTFRAGTLAGTLVVLSLALAACGQDAQDENEPEGTYKVDVISASFPGRQRLADETTLKITVQNKDTRTIPDLGVTVDGFYQRREDATLADPDRPIWIVNEPPFNSRSALTNTWTTGPLAAGKTRTLEWKVSALRAGTYNPRYRVNAGIDGKAKAEAFDGGPATGSFTVRISREPKSLEQN
jgi:hypothetical protein